jgi:hypothetical protein
MRQSRRQAVANARRTASNKVNRRRAGTSSPRARTSASRARMRSATGQPVPFQRQAGQFISAAAPRSAQQKASIAVTKLMPFL